MGRSLELRIEELEKKIAELEGRVPEQPTINFSPVVQITEQLKTLEVAQKICIERGNYSDVVPISKTIIETVQYLNSIRY